MRRRPVILKIPMKLGGRTKFQLEMWALSAAGGMAFSSKSFIGEGWSKVVESSVKPWSIVVNATKIPWSKFSHCSSTNLHHPDWSPFVAGPQLHRVGLLERRSRWSQYNGITYFLQVRSHWRWGSFFTTCSTSTTSGCLLARSCRYSCVWCFRHSYQILFRHQEICLVLHHCC